jgi:hypothetical protein
MVARKSSKITKQMKRTPIVIAIGAFLITPAAALEGFSTCHAAGTTVTSPSYS